MRTQRLWEAIKFAVMAHRGQTRKYSGVLYIIHPFEVAEEVDRLGYGEDVVIAALLHDVLEDTDTTFAEIEEKFGLQVAILVDEVTDISRPEDGNRAKRKLIDKEKLSKSSPEGATIKLVDIKNNWKSISENDPRFARIFRKEALDLLPVLSHGDPGALQEVKELFE